MDSYTVEGETTHEPSNVRRGQTEIYLLYNVLIIIRKQASKVQVVYYATQLPYEIPTLSCIGGASTASSSAIGYTYTRGVRYSYESRVLLTIRTKNIVSSSLDYGMSITQN